MDVSIIIVNYNTSQLTCQTINSVVQQTREVTYETIVVDNNSSDSSITDIRSKFGDEVKLIALPENIGFGRANNEGLKVAGGRNILFLNPDTILVDNPIKVLCNYLDQNTTVGAVGGNLYDENMLPSHSFERAPLTIAHQLNQLFLGIPYRIRYGKNYSFNNTNKAINVAQIVGADLMVRKDILDKIGGFDPAFFMYREESELCYRIIKAGYKLRVLPGSKIIHLEGKSFTIEQTRELMLLEGTRTYILKIYGKTYYSIYITIYILSIQIWILKSKLQGRSESATFWQCRLSALKSFKNQS